MHKLLKGFPLSAVRDVVKVDGTIRHEVAGLVTAEVPDKENEICDYDDSKPFYVAWSDDMYNATSTTGQDPSRGNVRLQHDASKVGGKVLLITYDDANKTISVVTEPRNDEVWRDVQGGFFTGFSQGGKYVYRRCETCQSDLGEPGNFDCPKCKCAVYCRYACAPVEVSYVDSPCLGKARFSYVKADGSSVEIVLKGREQPVALAPAPVAVPSTRKPGIAIVRKGKTKRVAGEDLPSSAFLIVGDSEVTGTWHLPVHFSTEDKTDSHLRDALSRIGQVKGITENERRTAMARLKRLCSQHGIDVDEDAGKVEGGDPMAVKKGMYQIGVFANLLNDIKYLRNACMYEGDCEDDPRDAEIASELNEWLTNGIPILLHLVEEETSELVTVAKTVSTGEKAMKENELLKAARASLAGHFKKAAAFHEKMADHHKALADEHASHMDTMKGMMGDGDETAKAMNPFIKANMAHHKCAMAVHEKMHKAHMAQAEHCGKMEVAHASEPPKEAAVQVEVTKVEPTPIAIVAKAAPVAEVPVVAEPAVAAVPGSVPGATISTGIGSMTPEAFGEMMAKAVGAAVVKAMGEQVAPPAAKVAGAALVARDGQQVQSVPNSEVSIENVGI